MKKQRKTTKIMATTALLTLILLSPPALAAGGEGAWPGYFTDLQKQTEQTFRDGKCVDIDGAGSGTWLSYEIPRGTFGAAKFIVGNPSTQWEVCTIDFYMLPGKIFVGRRKVNIAPGKEVQFFIPTKFVITESGTRFGYDIQHGHGLRWSGKFELRMAKK